MPRQRRSVRRTDRDPGLIAGSLEVRVLSRADWPLVEELFGPKGACGGCWCMHWRVARGGKSWDEVRGEPNRQALKRLVESGEVHAVLALAGGVPVGWCSFGPATSFPRLRNSRVLARPRTDGTWSIVCFYIASRYRRRGLGTRLLGAATERAFALGASEVEGFPVVPRSVATPVPGLYAWTGVSEMFRAQGFEPAARPEGARPILTRTRPAGEESRLA